MLQVNSTKLLELFVLHFLQVSSRTSCAVRLCWPQTFHSGVIMEEVVPELEMPTSEVPQDNCGDVRPESDMLHQEATIHQEMERYESNQEEATIHQGMESVQRNEDEKQLTETHTVLETESLQSGEETQTPADAESLPVETERQPGEPDYEVIHVLMETEAVGDRDSSTPAPPTQIFTIAGSSGENVSFNLPEEMGQEAEYSGATDQPVSQNSHDELPVGVTVDQSTPQQPTEVEATDQEPQQESTAEPCPHCGQLFPDVDFLRSHIQQMHSTSIAFSCAACLTLFNSLELAELHVMTCVAAREGTSVPNEQIHPVEIPAKLSRLASIKDGLILPSPIINVTRLPVKVIQDADTQDSELTVELTTSSFAVGGVSLELQKLKLQCPVCREKLPNSTTFSAHIHKHYIDSEKDRGVKIRGNAARIHPCHFCPKIFTDSYTCFQHSLTHASAKVRKTNAKKGGKKFWCTYLGCMKFCTNRDALEQHMLNKHSMRRSVGRPRKNAAQPKMEWRRPVGRSPNHSRQPKVEWRRPRGRPPKDPTQPKMEPRGRGRPRINPLKAGPRRPVGRPRKDSTPPKLGSPRRPGRKKLFRCVECDEKFSTNLLLRRHLRVHVELNEDGGREDVVSGPLRCALCGYVFWDRQELKLHVDLHPDPSDFDCYNCARPFKTITGFKGHALRCTSSQCRYCTQEFDSKYELLEHTERRLQGTHMCTVVPTCKKLFCTKKLLKIHEKQHAAKEKTAPLRKTFKCGQCGKAFQTSALLSSHRKLHQQEPPTPFGCHHCDERFGDKKALLNHTRGHKLAPFKCEVCFAGFLTPCEVTLHQMKKHTGGEKTFKCSLCKQPFSALADLAKHEGDTHKDARPFECGKCGRWFRTERDRNEHEGPFRCDKCSIDFRNRRSLQIHRDSCSYVSGTHASSPAKDEVVLAGRPTPQGTVSMSSDVTFECGACGRSFPSHAGLARHQADHSRAEAAGGEGDVACGKCMKRFGDFESLQSHVKSNACRNTTESPRQRRNAQPNTQYQCGECEEMFPSELLLKRHVTTHVRVKPMQCAQCSKVFVSVDSIRKHMKTHAAKRKHFEIPDSDLESSPPPPGLDDSDDLDYTPVSTSRTASPLKKKLFQSPQSYPDFAPKSRASHAESTARSVSCVTCGKTYLRPGALRNHERVHTGEKPFTCDVCGMTFRTNHHLKFHVNSKCLGDSAHAQNNKRDTARIEAPPDDAQSAAVSQNISDAETEAAVSSLTVGPVGQVVALQNDGEDGGFVNIGVIQIHMSG